MLDCMTCKLTFHKLNSVKIEWIFTNRVCKLTITCRQDYKRTFSFIANKNIFNNSIYLLKLVSWAKLFKT